MKSSISIHHHHLRHELGSAMLKVIEEFQQKWDLSETKETGDTGLSKLYHCTLAIHNL
ncbi:hypothetical protein DPMN_157084 [Dreissena polymorpha]|uniref:Uncharacterized protein n=2 Tax=Dreissena polymorpha TaxID=45954 RepID=A0A9D4IPN8_DREPO|nr:hypothetical protein DPMN_157084 [Dreissena polymorpha]